MTPDPARERAEKWLAEQCRAAYQAGIAAWVHAAWSAPEAMGWEYAARIAADAIAKMALARDEQWRMGLSRPSWSASIPWDAIEEGG